ncbi:hypothetical protein T484DRAFT_1906435 [Baffinella frigidus]|nr:hypothetical protein T484DRAFT_1906435 [Cryptophyta sp. CCMP2293]
MAGINGAPRRISAENPGHGDELLGKRLSPHPAPEEWPRIPCKGVIEKEVGKMDGVKSVSADPSSKDVVIDFDEPATWEAIKATLVKHDFPPVE